MKSTAYPVHPGKVVLLAGLVAGTLDIIAASTQFYINTGRNPELVLRFIASAVWGVKKAYSSDGTMAVMGLLFHYIIATGFAAAFVLLYLKADFIRRNIVAYGLLYGIVAWVIMNLLVLPMTYAPAIPFQWNKAIIAILILMFCIGLPIALVTHHFLKQNRTIA